ncbi:MAG: hypothetical protein AAF961_12950, partial [Planctomycetota bacterium]
MRLRISRLPPATAAYAQRSMYAATVTLLWVGVSVAQDRQEAAPLATEAVPAASDATASLPLEGDFEALTLPLETAQWTDAPADELSLCWDEALWRPFDRLRQLGLRHSSTHGRNVGRGIPLERSSWLNRPFRFDWYLGPLLGDDLVSGRVGQSSVLFGGVRAGWDFDYYWGLQWRFGWADPTLDQQITSEELSGRYFLSDVGILYYPWGDSKVRPYFVWGLGLVEVGSVRDDGMGQEATLLGMPLGAGVQVPQTPWLAWRMEVVDNIAFGGSG